MLGRWGKLALALGLAIIFLVGCTQESAQKVSLSRVQRRAGASSERWTCLGCKTSKLPAERADTEGLVHYLRSDILRVAVSGMVMPRETLGLYKELLRYMGDKLGKRVELVQRRTYHEVNELMEGRLVDVAFVCSLPYVLGHDRFGMELLVAPEVNGEPVYYSYIITRADSGIDSLGGLRGKTFAFMDPESNTGTLYPTYKLALMGESPTSFFYNYVYTYSHDNSVRAVLSKAVDGAAVDSLVLDYMAAGDPTIASQIRVIEKSPPFGIPPVVVHPALDPVLKEQLRGILLNLDGDARGREILRRMNIDRFILQSDSAYDSIREMYYAVQGRTLESHND